MSTMAPARPVMYLVIPLNKLFMYTLIPPNYRVCVYRHFIWYCTATFLKRWTYFPIHARTSHVAIDVRYCRQLLHNVTSQHPNVMCPVCSHFCVTKYITILTGLTSADEGYVLWPTVFCVFLSSTSTLDVAYSINCIFVFDLWQCLDARNLILKVLA